MSNRIVITIGRQYGSGGRQVGRLLSEKLGIPYYDKELMAEAAKDSGICQELFENHDEKPNRSLLFSLVTGLRGDPAGAYMDMPLNHKIFLAQFDTIRRIASEGSCIIVGRCADYVLRDDADVLNVFIKASMEDRIARAIDLHDCTPDKAEEIVRKQDKQRAGYYNYYASGTWGDVNNYHLCVDTSVFGVEGAADLIIDSMKRRKVEK